MAIGFAISAVGLLGLTQVGADGGIGVLIASSFVYSLGSAPIFTLTNDLILGTAPPERAGAASAISETGAELGGALSIAILGTIGTAIYRMQVDDSIPASVPPEDADTARDTLGGAVAVSGDLSAGVAEQMLGAAREAFTQGLQIVALISAILAALTAVGVALFLRQVRPAPHDATDADARDAEAAPVFAVAGAPE
jgi:DHA2 family multidrug resistance protein-like MFS transporter